MYWVRHATQQDVSVIQAMLQKAKVESDEVEKHLHHFFVVEQSEPKEMVGTMGMEVYPPFGVLRSLVLDQAVVNEKLSWQLLQILLSYAESLQLEEVYFIAGSAVNWFQELAFEVVERTQLPKELKTCKHLRAGLKRGVLMRYKCAKQQKKQANI